MKETGAAQDLTGSEPFSDAGAASPAVTARAYVAPDAVVVDMVPAPAKPVESNDLAIEMRRVTDPATGAESFQLTRRIRYFDHIVGPIVVPANLETWHTDLASVPASLTWLVPKTGSHLPAAILHDGLVLDIDEPASYIAAREIFRDEADRILRDAMAVTGTGLVRRWLVWAAVSIPTMWHGRQVNWSRPQKLYYRAVLILTFGTIAVLGGWATVDLLDLPGLPQVPWMGASPFGEILGGLAGAVVIPLLLGCLWGRFRPAGWIIAPLIAFVGPVLVPVMIGGWIYDRVENLVLRFQRVAWLILGSFIAANCIVVGLFTWRSLSAR